MAEDEAAGGPGTRFYAVPFDRVWRAAVALLAPGRGWTVVEADPRGGSIVAERRTPVLRRRRRLHLHLSLDAMGRTRVDASFRRADGFRTARGSGRRAARLLRRLDRELAAKGPA